MNAVIVLAAGSSSRLGKPKQLLEFKGRSLLRIAAETALEVCPEQVLVVLGYRTEEMLSEFEGLALAVVNSEWEEGLGSSIRRGVKALDLNTEAVVLMLCDQPLVTADHLRRLLGSVSSERTVSASRYPDGRLGVPAAFHRSRFGELMSLKGDRGARDLLLEKGVIGVEGAELVDIDTWEDFEGLDPDCDGAL